MQQKNIKDYWCCLYVENHKDRQHRILANQDLRVYQSDRHLNRPLGCGASKAVLEEHSIWWRPMERTLISRVGGRVGGRVSGGGGGRLSGGCEDLTTGAALWRMSRCELLSSKHILQSRAINHSDSSYIAPLLRPVPVAPFISPIITLIMLHCNYLCSCLSRHHPTSSVLTGPVSVSVWAAFSAPSTGPGKGSSIKILQEERISWKGLQIGISSNCRRNSSNTWLGYG